MASCNKRGAIVRLDLDELVKLLVPEDPEAQMINAVYRPEIRAIELHLVNTGLFTASFTQLPFVTLEALHEINADVYNKLIEEKARVAAETTSTCGPLCVLCSRKAERGSRLCIACNGDRVSAASAERTMRGEGLTWSNAERYSEDNWIRAVKSGRREA